MSGTELGHQVFQCSMDTPIPDLSSVGVNTQAMMQGWAGQIQTALESIINVGTLLSHGLSSTQSVTVKNLQFPIIGGWVKIAFQVDIVTDIDWVEATVLIGIVGGISLGVAGVLSGQAALILLGIVVTAAALTFTIYEILREPIPSQVTNLAYGFLLVAALAIGVYAVRRHL